MDSKAKRLKEELSSTLTESFLTYMTIPKESLQQLKQIHLKQTGENLTDSQTLELGNKLITLLSIVARPIDSKLKT